MIEKIDFSREIKVLKKAFDSLDPPISKNELARRAKIHKTTLFNLWRGHNAPTTDTMNRLARELGVSFERTIRIGK